MASTPPLMQVRSAKGKYLMDDRALKILFDTFWSPSGWKPEAMRGLSPDDFAYAKSKGVMFDPVTLEHDQALDELSRVIDQLDKHTVVDAFLASLSTRRLDWRSALGSYAVFQNLTRHSPSSSDGRCCDICGFYLGQFERNLNVLNFERHKWGGVRHQQVDYALFDLRLFLNEKVRQPTKEDIDIFSNIMTAIATAPTDVTSAKLHSCFAKLIKSNKAERDIIVAILGYCGILGTPEHPGFTDSFIAARERRIPDRRFVDMPYPACWWQGTVGVNEEKLRKYFGHIL